MVSLMLSILFHCRSPSSTRSRSTRQQHALSSHPSSYLSVKRWPSLEWTTSLYYAAARMHSLTILDGKNSVCREAWVANG